MTNAGETKKFQHKRGHNAVMTGLGMLVFGGAIYLAMINGGEEASTSGLAGFSVLVAFAGLLTLIIGFGLRRERR